MLTHSSSEDEESDSRDSSDVHSVLNPSHPTLDSSDSSSDIHSPLDYVLSSSPQSSVLYLSSEPEGSLHSHISFSPDVSSITGEDTDHSEGDDSR